MRCDLINTEKLSRELLESAPDAIVVVDQEGDIVWVNSQTEKLFGYRREELLGQKVEMLIPARFRNKHRGHRVNISTDSLARSMRGGLDLYGVRRDGSEFLADINLSSLSTDEGVLFSSAIRDISERKSVEEILRQSEEQFRLLVEQVQDYAIFMLNPQGQVVSWNKGAERIKGYQVDEIIGKHFSCFYPPEAIKEGKPERELRAAIDQGHTVDECWRIRKGGQRFWASVVITALFDKVGCLKGFAKITRDMTERKRAESILQEKNLELQHAAETKNRFLAHMSHELRTPLNGIIGFAEFLVDGKPGNINAKQKDYLEDILNSGKHLLQLINDVLDLAKLKAGKMELYPEKFSLSEAIEEVCAVSKPIVEKKGIELEVNVAPELDCVTLDQQKFKQILYNLLSNAVKFTDNEGKVKIRAARYDAHRFKLVVQDTGIGINPEDLGRLFEEFTQLEPAATRHYQGTGLGLSLTRKIVECQGGKVSAESEVGKGSSFTVLLPLAMDEETVEPAKKAPKP